MSAVFSSVAWNQVEVLEKAEWEGGVSEKKVSEGVVACVVPIQEVSASVQAGIEGILARYVPYDARYEIALQKQERNRLSASTGDFSKVPHHELERMYHMFELSEFPWHTHPHMHVDPAFFESLRVYLGKEKASNQKKK